MSNPYRTAETPRRTRSRRLRGKDVALAVAFIWVLSASRLALAVERDEPFGAEPALAGLLTVIPPIAFAIRAARDG